MKTTICFAFTVLTLLFGIQSYAQSIKGLVIDKDNAPVPFATVSYYNAEDSAFVGGTYTEMEGDFIIENLQSGTYYLKISFTGYVTSYSAPITISDTKSIEDLGSIQLREESQMLDEVLVQAMQNSVINKGDRLEMNVSNTMLASEQNAYEVVKEAPGVTVDHQGSLKLNGKEGVKVVIDGRDTYVKGEELKSFLESMPAESIQKIEVMNNPSAKFEAEGSAGVINICMKKNYKKGFNGMIYSNYTRSQINEYALGANLNYMKGNWNTFANINLDRGGRFREMDISRTFLTNGNTTRFNQKGEDVRRKYIPSLQTGFDYQINENQSIGMFANLSYKSGRQYWNTAGELLDGNPASDVQIASNNDFWSTSLDQKFNLHYEAKLDSSGSSLMANLDYVVLEDQTDSRFDNAYTFINSENSDREIFTAYNPTRYEILAARLDYTQPLLSLKGKWEAGMKISNVVSDHKLNFFKLINDKEVSYSERDNYFTYKENIYAAYSSINSQLNEHWSVQLGLRAEYTDSEGFSKTTYEGVRQSYLDLFPSLFITQKVNDDYELSYSYSRRINRPRYKHLNPYRFYIDPYTSIQGNPQMRPQYTDSYKITQTFFRKYNLILGYDASVDFIGEVPLIDAQENTTVLSIRNMEEFNNFSATVIAPVSPTKNWTINNMMTSAFQYFRVNIENESILNEQFFFNARSNHRFKLPNQFIAEMNFDYRGPVAHGVYKLDGQWGLDAGVQRTFYNEKLRVSLNFKDIFRTRRISGSLGYGENEGRIDQYLSDQSVSLGIQYNFSKGEQFRAKTKDFKLDELNRAAG